MEQNNHPYNDQPADNHNMPAGAPVRRRRTERFHTGVPEADTSAVNQSNQEQPAPAVPEAANAPAPEMMQQSAPEVTERPLRPVSEVPQPAYGMPEMPRETFAAQNPPVADPAGLPRKKPSKARLFIILGVIVLVLAAVTVILLTQKGKGKPIKVAAGDIVTFGKYEQDNDPANGPEAIEWIVLDYNEKENKALLLSKYGLDAKPYNTVFEEITWEKCSLRNWLNSEFLQAAFSMKEQAAIMTTAVDNSDSQGLSEWNINGGNNTKEKIFLLSCAEANRYLNVNVEDDNINVRITVTSYAIAQGAYTDTSYPTNDGEPAGMWWLRSPGGNQGLAAVVFCSGSLIDIGVQDVKTVVRPALWVNLKSGIITENNVFHASVNSESNGTDNGGGNTPNWSAGNEVTLGSCEQDYDWNNGSEPIEWIVLDYDQKEHKALLLSKYGLTPESYHSEKTDITWEECWLRKWLNDSFLYSAFSEKEQAAILMTAVDNSDSQGYSKWKTKGGNNTEDRIFLLSYAEASRYLGGIYENQRNIEARCAPTTYARQKEAFESINYRTSDNKWSGWWWLRSPGERQNSAACVVYDGALHDMTVDINRITARPAMWVDVQSDCFRNSK